MKTAVIYSGQARTFARTYPNQKWFLLRRLANPVFYVSVEDNADAKSMEALKKDYPEVHIELVKPPQMEEPPFALTDFAPYAITPTKTPGVGPLQGLMRQFWHNSRAWKFAVEQGLKDDGDTMVVRMRPDLHIQHFRHPGTPGLNEAISPQWGTYGGANDRCAFMGFKAAEAWMTAYDVLPALLEAGCPFHPETIIAAAVERAGCYITPHANAWFAFRRGNGGLGDPGTLEHPIVLPQDFANIL